MPSRPLRPRPEQESPMKFLLTVLAALLLGCASSQADSAYYFAANGSDRKPCTQTLPCRTIAKAQSLSYLPGDSINFQGGDTFTGCLRITPTNVPSCGLPSNPITVQSYGTGSATLTNDCTGDRAGLVTINGVSGVIVNNLKIAVSPSITLGAGVLVQNSFSLNPVSTVIVQNSEITGAHTTGALAPDLTSEVLILGWAHYRKCGPLTNIQVLNNQLHGATATSTDGNGITGTGCDKVFTDVERLCNVHIPAWLATDGMSEAKIAAFYEDPIKKACDEWSIGKAYSFRALSIESEWRWRMQRSARFGAWLGRGMLRRLGRAVFRPSVQPAPPRQTAAQG